MLTVFRQVFHLDQQVVYLNAAGHQELCRLLPFHGSCLLLLDNRASDEDGRKLPYLIGDVDGFLLHLVIFAGSTLSTCQQVVGYRAEVIAEL